MSSRVRRIVARSTFSIALAVGTWTLAAGFATPHSAAAGDGPEHAVVQRLGGGGTAKATVRAPSPILATIRHSPNDFGVLLTSALAFASAIFGCSRLYARLGVYRL